MSITEYYRGDKPPIWWPVSAPWPDPDAVALDDPAGIEVVQAVPRLDQRENLGRYKLDLEAVLAEALKEGQASDQAEKTWNTIAADVCQRRTRSVPSFRCGSVRKTLVDLRDHRRSLAVRLRCNRLECPECYARLRGQAVLHAAACILHQVPAEGLPSRITDGAQPPLPVRQEAVYCWRGPAAEWEAAQARIVRAAGPEGYGYLRIEKDELVEVLTDTNIDGADALDAATAARKTAEAIWAAPPIREAISWGGLWRRPQKVRRYRDLPLTVSFAEAASAAGSLGARVRTGLGGADGRLRSLAVVFGAAVPEEVTSAYYEFLGTGDTVHLLAARRFCSNAGSSPTAAESTLGTDDRPPQSRDTIHEDGEDCWACGPDDPGGPPE